ncbi:hypothetical protein SS05631_c01150 [Sinorhizobium sp. CCBAU 05631]|nr:hypothetical protein SS05631_c01150 [Sinorhizobium sp. CCBAU 05631]
MPVVRAADNELLHFSFLPMLAPDRRGRRQSRPVRLKAW